MGFRPSLFLKTDLDKSGWTKTRAALTKLRLDCSNTVGNGCAMCRECGIAIGVEIGFSRLGSSFDPAAKPTDSTHTTADSPQPSLSPVPGQVTQRLIVVLLTPNISPTSTVVNEYRSSTTRANSFSGVLTISIACFGTLAACVQITVCRRSAKDTFNPSKSNSFLAN